MNQFNADACLRVYHVRFGADTEHTRWAEIALAIHSQGDHYGKMDWVRHLYRFRFVH